MGKNSVAQIAFGRNPEEEYKDNLRNISKVFSSELFFLLGDYYLSIIWTIIVAS
jgi:hypothetical protein